MVGTILGRLHKHGDEIVKVKGGWGLAEWYGPHIRRLANGKTKKCRRGGGRRGGPGGSRLLLHLQLRKRLLLSQARTLLAFVLGHLFLKFFARHLYQIPRDLFESLKLRRLLTAHAVAPSFPMSCWYVKRRPTMDWMAVTTSSCPPSGTVDAAFDSADASSRQRAAASRSPVGPACRAVACLRSVITSAPSAS